MNRVGLLIFFYFFVLGASTALPFDGAGPEPVSYRAAPRPLLELWLRFHESGLCQGLDVDFDFNESGMKVRGLMGDEKSYQKFQEMLEPLQSSFRIELDVSRPKVEKRSSDQNENDPPPGIWENHELRYNMGDDSVAPTKEQPELEQLRDTSFYEILKQRLRLYAEQILDQKKKMERSASDMRVLVQIALDSAIDPALRAKACRVSLAHAQELGKLLTKIDANLSLAIPKSKARGRSSPNGGKADGAQLIESSSDRIANDAHVLAQIIYRFVHPEQFTVDLGELRQPGLLESVRDLSKMNSEFQKQIDRYAATKLK
jgi:hypothetical protein